MAPKKVTIKLRPFTPGGKGFPKCGQGKQKQIDWHDDLSTGEMTDLFQLPPEGSSFPELVDLMNGLNAVATKGTGELLRRKRESTGEKRLQLTLALDRGKLYITYSLPVRRRRTVRGS